MLNHVYHFHSTGVGVTLDLSDVKPAHLLLGMNYSICV